MLFESMDPVDRCFGLVFWYECIRYRLRPVYWTFGFFKKIYLYNGRRPVSCGIRSFRSEEHQKQLPELSLRGS